MKILGAHGDLFMFDVDAIAHGVNCRGYMGAGIAASFKQRFPQMFQEYRKHCLDGTLHPGGIYAYRHGHRYIYNIASQRDPGATARVEWLRLGLHIMLFHASRNNVQTIAIPWIGCGIGGLEKADLVEILDELAKNEEFDKISLTIVTKD
jgi:O-acetyl-ADP-ribose deacetylase (regulator of RNase III)